MMICCCWTIEIGDVSVCMYVCSVVCVCTYMSSVCSYLFICLYVCSVRYVKALHIVQF